MTGADLDSASTGRTGTTTDLVEPPGIGEIPAVRGDFDADLARATDRLRDLVDVVESLPPRSERSTQQQRRAETAHRAARRLRRGFLNRHAERCYDDLTAGRTQRPGLDQLARLAAELFPGLVPTQDQLAADARLPQHRKEGWEIDQGLLFHALLDSPAAGTHLLDSLRKPTPQALAALPEFQRTGRAELGVTTVSRHDGVAHLELRNDTYLNAEDDAAVEALEIGTDLVLLDDASHVGVLRGGEVSHRAYAGRRVFSAGINLTHLYGGRISLLGFMLRREAGYITKFARGLHDDDHERTAKPWTAGVDTFAIGGGLQILPVMDRVVATDDAWFSLPAMQEGLVPGLANLRLLPRVGGSTTRDLIFWGRRLRAADPEAAGLCDETVPAEAMDDAVRRAAEHLDNPAVAANRELLLLGEEPLDLFRRYLARYALEQAYRLYSPDLIANLERTWINRR